MGAVGGECGIGLKVERTALGFVGALPPLPSPICEMRIYARGR